MPLIEVKERSHNEALPVFLVPDVNGTDANFARTGKAVKPRTKRQYTYLVFIQKFGYGRSSKHEYWLTIKATALALFMNHILLIIIQYS